MLTVDWLQWKLRHGPTKTARVLVVMQHAARASIARVVVVVVVVVQGTTAAVVAATVHPLTLHAGALRICSDRHVITR